MHDTTPDTTPPDTDTTAAVDVATAAARLGITSDAVRARIRRGKLQAVKRGNVWHVLMPAGLSSKSFDDADATDDATKPDSDTTRRDTDATPPAVLVDHLEAEIAYLRGELTAAREQAARERERADVLQREALQRLEALTASQDTPGSSESVGDDATRVQSPAAPPAGLWARLRRMFTG